MMVAMVLFWAAIILGIVWLITTAGRGWSLSRERPVTRREHCEQMAAHFADHGEVMGREAMDPKMREHCEPMAAQFADHAAAVSRT